MGLLIAILIIFANRSNFEKNDIKNRLANITEDLKNYGQQEISLNSLIYYNSLLHKNSKFDYQFVLKVVVIVADN